jgi:hypothetical protein
MYHSTGVQKLSETQKSKLRNGHPVRIKKGSVSIHPKNAPRTSSETQDW